MASLMTRLFGSSKSPKTRSKPIPVQLGIDALEDRVVPTVSVSSGLIIITGTNFNDNVNVYYQHSKAGGSYVISESVNAGPAITTTIPETAGHGYGTISGILFHGKDGDDRFSNNTNLKSTAYGDNGNDYLIGGTDTDTFYGGAGGDVLDGRDGNDSLYGNTGRDYLFGGNGDDALDGGDDNYADFLSGGAGKDSFQMEGYGNRNNPYSLYTNLDDPVDYNAAEDIFYGADPMKVTTLSTATTSTSTVLSSPIVTLN